MLGDITQSRAQTLLRLSHTHIKCGTGYASNRHPVNLVSAGTLRQISKNI